MAKSQNSPRGSFAKQRIDLAASGEIYLHDYSSDDELITGNSTGLIVAGGVKVSNKANAQLTGNSTGLVVVGGVKISNAKYVTANTTGYIFTTAAALPAARSSAKIMVGTDSTGVNFVGVNTTGTTWKYLNVTSVKPT